MKKYVSRLFSFLGGLPRVLTQSLDASQVAIYVSVATVVALLRAKRLRTYLHILRRDFVILYRLLIVNRALRRIRDETTVVDLFRSSMVRHPNKPMFITRERRWTYLEVEEYTNSVANYFAMVGFREGDTVALIMENRPEYVLLWLGLSKIGVVTALINTNLRLKPLAHSIGIVNSKAIIFSPAMAANLIVSKQDLRDNCCDNMRYFAFGQCPEAAELNADDIEDSVLKSSKDPPSYYGKVDDKLMYIYTSGTTGLPKAAIIKHMRYIQIGVSLSKMVPVTEKDVIYIYLPFYHAASGILGLYMPLIVGATAIISPKFSASKFWTDCAEYQVTVCQYIGEICRYLLMQPERPEDRMHQVTRMYGNGLRKDIWNEFQARFGLSYVVEIYGSTEGTSCLANLDNTPGAIGYFPWISKLIGKYMPVNIIRVDPITGVPLRDTNGRCITCEPGETGEIVATIKSNNPMTKFDGYADKAATAKKIYNDCFAKGDKVFASGDLVYKDELGYVYFKDRTGDTFRWKGENVSTTEVEDVVSSVLDDPSIGCVIYGVEVPGVEGRAGMLVLVDPSRKVDLTKLLDGLRAALPAYAVPLFLRITTQADLTGTFKTTKVNFQKAGFDPGNCHPDPVYFFNALSKPPCYVPLDQTIIDQINNRELRL
ncbi:long-chain fatty acid transport protein 4-like [Tropilaelaps mercedesae]|uniref:Very long-chain fatty acid transport protein n=1 Tax=Tropilaelaps mercedesae TaxID=418985 RepID=A0A1V9XRH1_9ACAR|nr:long-chain fatty acid transport protein 4-like [Tropilaelaps mercedesae]